MINFKSFKAKTYFAFGAIAFISIVLLATVIRLFTILEDLDSYVGSVADLKNHVQRVKENENKIFLFDTRNEEFINNNNSIYAGNIDSLQNNMINEIEILLDHELTKSYDLDGEFTTLSEAFQNYYGSINDVKEKIKIRGFGEFKLAGELGSQMSALSVKSSMSAFDVPVDEISKMIYDFQISESDEKAQALEAKIQDIIYLSESDSSGLTSEFQSLLAKFKDFSEISREIGMTGEQGIRADLISSSEMILEQCKTLEDTVKKNIGEEKDFLYLGFAVLGKLQVLSSVYFGLRMSSVVIGRLNNIKSNIGELSSGIFPQRIDVKQDDELGAISSSINELTDRIEYAADYAREIGKGNLSDSYKEEYSKDAIAQAIMEMQEKLQENAEIDRLRTWRTEGLAKFANILQENKDSTEALCYEIISSLVKYTGSNQGAFYTLEDNEGQEILQIKGVYAYEREKFLEVEIEKGEGMIGEVWKEGETIVLTEIPEDYFQITSGLGESLPKCVVMLPLMYNDQFFGVIEMASFKVFKEAELEFLEEVGRNIAGTLAGAKVNQRTKTLLGDSQRMQDEMREQEEMMRQNLEEMQATQDTFDERENQYQDEIKKLKKRLNG